jgi:hypothetical protein
MAAPFPNIYTHRKVAETSSKACDVCYKPSTSVLITPDKKVRLSSDRAGRDQNLTVKLGLLLHLPGAPEGPLLLLSHH